MQNNKLKIIKNVILIFILLLSISYTVSNATVKVETDNDKVCRKKPLFSTNNTTNTLEEIARTNPNRFWNLAPEQLLNKRIIFR